MFPVDIARQGQIENAMMQHIIEAIRTTIAWQVHGDAARKLSTLRFITQSFQRHLHRLVTLEEYDGYMRVVIDVCPALAKTVDELRTEHDRFRAQTDRIVHDLERLNSVDDVRLARTCNHLQALLDQFESHARREVDVLQEALDRDTGGEG